MKVLKPTQLGIFRYSRLSNSLWNEFPKGTLYWAIPVQGDLINEGYFYQTRRLKENTVVHSKPVQAGMRTLVKRAQYTRGASTYYTYCRGISQMTAWAWITIQGISFDVRVMYNSSNVVTGCTTTYHAMHALNGRSIWLHNNVQNETEEHVAEAFRTMFRLPTNAALVGQKYNNPSDIMTRALPFAALCARSLAEWFLDHHDYVPNRKYNFGSTDIVTEGVTTPEPSASFSSFLFKEDERIANDVDPILLGRSTNYYWLNVMEQEVTQKALENLPTANDNNIQNVSAIAHFIKSLVLEHKIELPKSWQSAWLQYRYAATTSLSDIRENISFIKRVAPIDSGLTTYGVQMREIDGTQVTMRCTIKLRRRELDLINSILDKLYSYGLLPDFYTLWDSIPFSFIVDWFLPIGDLASAIDKRRVYAQGNYDFTAIIYSLKYERDGVQCYSRWTKSSLPDLNALYWFESDASTKTVVKRIIDATALITG